MTQTTEHVYAARIIDGEDLFWFASLNGADWIGVSDDPRLATVENVQQIINGNGRTRPMMATRGFLRHYGAVFLS